MSVHDHQTGPTLLTVDDVARQLVVSPATVRRMAHSDELPSLRVGPGARLLRFRAEDIDAVIRGGHDNPLSA